MTSGTHALILAQSAFEAVCKERDEIKTQADNMAKELEASKAYAERCKQGCIKLSFAIDRIDYACGEPNEMEVSDYCIHQNEEAVVERVKKQLEAMREAIKEARIEIQYAEAGFAGLALRVCPNDSAVESVLNRMTEALAKLQSLA